MRAPLLIIRFLCILLFMTGAPFSFGAEEPPCNCSELPIGDEAGDLIDLNTKMNDHFSLMDGNSFQKYHRSPQQIESYKLSSEYHELRRRLCPKKEDRKKVSVMIRVIPTTVLGTKSADEATGFHPLLWNSVLQLYEREHKKEAENCPKTQSKDDCYATHLGKVRAVVEGEIKAATVDNLYQQLPDPEGMRVARRLPTGVLVKAMYAGNIQDYVRVLDENKNRLSTDQKLMILSDLYRSEDKIYDKKRRDEPLFGDSKHSIDGDKILGALRDYYSIKKASESGTVELFAGICRDHASLIALTAQALGFKNSFVVTHTKTVGNHATVVFQDPADKSRYYKMDYLDNAKISNKEGPALLTQVYSGEGNPSATSSYRIHEPYGKTLAILPSEMNKILSEAVQIDVRKKEPLAQTRSSIAGSRIEVSDSSSVQLFYGKDLSNTQYVGAAHSMSYFGESYTPGKVGYGLALSKTSDTLAHAFVEFEQQAKSPDFKLVFEEIKAKADATFLASFMLTENISDLKSKYLLKSASDYEVLNLGSQVTYQNKKQSLYGKLRAEAQLALGTSNVSQVGGVNGAVSSLTVFLNHHLYTAEGRVKLAETALGRLYLFCAATVVFDHFGARASAKVGVDTEKTAARFEMIGRLQEDTPLFREGSLRKAKVSLSYMTFKNLQLYLTAEKSLEEENQKHPLDPDVEPAFQASGGVRGEF